MKPALIRIMGQDGCSLAELLVLEFREVGLWNGFPEFPTDRFFAEETHAYRMCLDALRRSEQRITMWGAGMAARKFLQVGYCAEAALLATELYEKPEPVNTRTAVEISIRKFVDLIAWISCFAGEVALARTKPGDQPFCPPGVSRTEKELGCRAPTSLEESIRKALHWYSRTPLQDAVRIICA